MKKICLITPGHISSNPRLVKEAIALSGAGYNVHIVFTQYLDYLKQEDSRILTANPSWEYSCLDWTNSAGLPKFRRYFSGILQKLAGSIFKLTSFAGIEKLAINRHYFWQLKEAISANADLYIAHNLGALPVAKAAADINQAKSGFDAEDFHRHEGSDDLQNPTVLLNKYIEEKYIPGTDHLTAASPLIAAEYEKLIHGVKMQTILNVFPKQELKLKEGSGEMLKLFWFSQRIGKGRGIEEVIEALALLNEPVELHLLGDLRTEDKRYFLGLIEKNELDRKNFHFYQPISPEELIAFTTNFDIGLATETGIPFNREICLTNKIFTYIQAGLAIIASDTKAQLDLISRYPGIGLVYKRKVSTGMADAIKIYINEKEALNIAKRTSLELARTLNWEQEQILYLNKITLNLKK